MEKAIALLDEVKESIINAYAEKSHLSRNKIARLMDEETWMNAEKALQLGFVDGILFSKKNPFVPEEPEKTDPDEEETKESPEEETDEKKKAQHPCCTHHLKRWILFCRRFLRLHPKARRSTNWTSGWSF